MGQTRGQFYYFRKKLKDLSSRVDYRVHFLSFTKTIVSFIVGYKVRLFYSELLSMTMGIFLVLGKTDSLVFLVLLKLL